MKVQPRALASLLQKPVDQRLPIIAEGLALVVEHVGELRRSVSTLQGVGQLRAAAILDVVAGEEAVKALILLDLVRVGWADQVVASRQIRSFSSHLARGIYAEVSMMNPGSFRDVREMVARHRPSQYLDGPNDVDWVYRTRLSRSARRLSTSTMCSMRTSTVGCRPLRALSRLTPRGPRRRN